MLSAIILTLLKYIMYLLLHHWHPATGGVHPLMDPLASGSPLARLPYPGATLGTPILAHPLTDSEVLRQQLFGEEKAPRPCTCSAFLPLKTPECQKSIRLVSLNTTMIMFDLCFSIPPPPRAPSVRVQALLSVICPSHPPSLVPYQQHINFRPCSRPRAQSCRSRDWPWNNSGSITTTTTPSPRKSTTGRMEQVNRRCIDHCQNTIHKKKETNSQLTET